MEQSVQNNKVNSTSAAEDEQPPQYADVSYLPHVHRVTPSPTNSTPQYNGVPSFNMDDMLIQLSKLSDERNINSVGHSSTPSTPPETPKQDFQSSSSCIIADSLEISHGRSLKRSHEINDDSENQQKKTPRHVGITNHVRIYVLKADQNQNKKNESEKEEEMESEFVMTRSLMDSTTPTPSDSLLGQLASQLEDSLRIETKPPNALICALCSNLMTVTHDPVMLHCCCNSFCYRCVSTTMNQSKNMTCPGDGCNQIVGSIRASSNLKLRGIVASWLQRSGAEEYRAQTQNTTRTKLASVENCPPPSLKCPICTDLMTTAITMECCGTNFCNECIAIKLSCSNDTACPGVGCTCKQINRASYTINYPLQNVARTWFDRLERLKNSENSKMLEPTIPSGKTSINQQSNMNSPSETDSSSQRSSAYKMTRSAKKLANTFSPYNRNNSNKKSEQGRENGKQKQVSRNLRSAFSSKQSSENSSDDQNAFVVDYTVPTE